MDNIGLIIAIISAAAAIIAALINKSSTASVDKGVTATKNFVRGVFHAGVIAIIGVVLFFIIAALVENCNAGSDASDIPDTDTITVEPSRETFG